MADKKPYKGILSRPIPLHDDIDQLAKDVFKRVDALCDHYGVAHEPSFSNVFQLMLALARDHVPGFQIETPRPPFRRGIHKYAVLLLEMVKYINAGHSKRNAARLFAQKYPGFGWNADSVRVLFTEMTTTGGRQRNHEAVIEVIAFLEAISSENNSPK